MTKFLSALAAAGAVAALAVPSFAATKGVSVKDDFFSAKKITVSKGTTVKWTWKGDNPHNVVGKGFNSGVKTSGTFSRKFKKAGTFKYRCTIHSGMKGTVVVK
jgi:plastocyanin